VLFDPFWAFMKTLLTIAGFDPSSGAGASADLAVFSAHSAFGIAALTAITVQSTLGVRAVYPVGASLLQQKLQCLTEDLPPDGVKIGMLATRANVDVVSAYVEMLQTEGRRSPVVLDPVIRSSSGGELLDGEGLEALRRRLLPLVDWITPNRDELSQLSGLGATTELEVEKAAATLQKVYPQLGVIVTGGDADGSDLVLPVGEKPVWLRNARVVSNATHGTGCAFSSAFLCGLVEGLDAPASATRAKEYVTEAIRRAVPIGHGKGPMNLLWPLRDV
jgi:hydroxymethylpyrimidine/phosphomethylpyrimidine kinase